MSDSLLTWVIALCSIICVTIAPAPAQAERKVALVVGNAHYKNPSLILSNPKNDAEDVATLLRSLDFDVTLTVEADKRSFDIAMTQFARTATGADAALFYYAGHALQYQGRNYLMPIDGEIEDEVSLRYQMVMLDDVRAALERADGVKIIILDACRNNPVVDNLRRKMAGMSRSIDSTRGLARIDKALGMVVAYSTAADDVAADGSGRNSPFTSALLRRLKEPGLEIGSMFRRVAADVNEKTNGRQRPETYVSLIGEYYMNQKDKPAWDQIKDSLDPTAFRNFIAQFPLSPRASDAQYRIQIIEQLGKQPDTAVADKSAELTSAQARLAEDERARLAAQDQPKSERVLIQDLKTKAPTPGQKQASLNAGPAPAVAAPSPSVVSQDQICKRDEERLARLRAGQIRDDVVRFERELACERLRPQVMRLRESIAVETVKAENGPAGIPQPVVTTAPVSSDVSQQSSPTPPPSQTAAPSSASVNESCKRDEERLARLRSGPVLADIVKFEQELRCQRLRTQVTRLRESVAN